MGDLSIFVIASLAVFIIAVDGDNNWMKDWGQGIGLGPPNSSELAQRRDSNVNTVLSLALPEGTIDEPAAPEVSTHGAAASESIARILAEPGLSGNQEHPTQRRNFLSLALPEGTVDEAAVPKISTDGSAREGIAGRLAEPGLSGNQENQAAEPAGYYEQRGQFRQHFTREQNDYLQERARIEAIRQQELREKQRRNAEYRVRVLHQIRAARIEEASSSEPSGSKRKWPSSDDVPQGAVLPAPGGNSSVIYFPPVAPGSSASHLLVPNKSQRVLTSDMPRPPPPSPQQPDVRPSNNITHLFFGNYTR